MKTKSTSQTATKPSWKSAILLAITALALFVLPAVALADPPPQCPNPLYATSWTGAVDNNWFNASNWSNGVPTCGPDVSYDAFIPNGTPQINTGAASACAVSLAQDTTTESAILSVDGSSSSLTLCTNIFVGYQGRGKLSVTNGGSVTAITASIASQPGSNGSVTVDGTHSGTNSTWAVADELDVAGLQSASGGTGLLTVTNSGTVTATNVHVWKSGTLTGNATVSTTNGTAIDGTLAPNFTLTVNGALTFNGNAAPLMQCSVTPQNLNQVDLSVSGAASLAGKLSVTMTGTFTPGTQFTLLQSQGALTGTFTNGVSITFPTGQNFTPQINYDAHHVYLYLSPNTGS